MIHTACGVHCNITRLHHVPQAANGIRDTIKAAWLIKCPTCGKEVRRKTKTDVIRAAKTEGFSN